MSFLIAITYPDEATARAAAAEARGLEAERKVTFDDLVIAVHDEDGRVRLLQHMDEPDQQRTPTQRIARYGALIGATIVVPPLFGPFVIGAAIKDLHDHGINDRFMKELAASLEPRHAALFALATDTTPDEFAAALARYEGTVLHKELDAEEEARLAEAKAASARGEDPTPAV